MNPPEGLSTDTKTPARKPANDNPWYCLATMHGEQPVDGFDHDLANKNCDAWEQWFGDVSQGKREQLESTFRHRTGGKLTIPDRSAEPDFSYTHFARKVSFKSFRFLGPANFNFAIFSDDVFFSQTIFSDADFRSATFSADANFAGSHFNGSADYRKAKFSEGADFEAATFQSANFRSVDFGTTDFRSTTFHDTADFSSTKFIDVAEFNSAHFLMGAVFTKATFFSATTFHSATFSRTALFSGASFETDISFVNAKFAANTIFAGAHFGGSVPDFRGASLHQATEWHNVIWPKPPRNKKTAQRQVYAYERLKQEMEQLKKHEDELDFFRKELRARRGLVPILSARSLLNIAYQALSGYGSSIRRPLLWLLLVFVGGTAIFARAPLYCGAPMPIDLAAKLSFFNIFAFLPDRREIITAADMIKCLSSTTQAVSAAQTLIGVVLLFLLGLALRNLFRMK